MSKKKSRTVGNKECRTHPVDPHLSTTTTLVHLGILTNAKKVAGGEGLFNDKRVAAVTITFTKCFQNITTINKIKLQRKHEHTQSSQWPSKTCYRKHRKYS